MGNKQLRMRTDDGFIEGVMRLDRPPGMWMKEYTVGGLAVVDYSQQRVVGGEQTFGAVYLLHCPACFDKLYAYLESKGLEDAGVLLCELKLGQSAKEIMSFLNKTREEFEALDSNLNELLNSEQFQEVLEGKIDELANVDENIIGGLIVDNINKELMEKLDAAKRKPIEPSAN